jgi:DNA polymerase III delta prime subunit
VNGSSVKIDNTLPVCDGECVDTPTGNVTAELDAIAQQLSDVMTRAANVLASAKATSDKNVSKATKRNRTDAERAKKKAEDYTALAKTLTIQFPQVIKTCPQAPAYCETVDRQYAIESLKGLYANQRNSTQRTIARAYFRNTGKTSRKDSLVKQAKDLEQQGLAALAKLPRFETQCK